MKDYRSEFKRKVDGFYCGRKWQCPVINDQALHAVHVSVYILPKRARWSKRVWRGS